MSDLFSLAFETEVVPAVVFDCVRLGGEGRSRRLRVAVAGVQGMRGLGGWSSRRVQGCHSMNVSFWMQCRRETAEAAPVRA